MDWDPTLRFSVSATTRATHSLGGDAAVSVGDAITTRARN